ncbi:EAL domain-containing protein [Methylobacterium sp. WL9]|uniref:putative bifunctional diguanylate cyclase/phosphodiesterase n=1 Tax=Methylobacterium sp. WL9 TaxID=2603898 RepID=UPI0011CC5AA7|nr:EAL domain-containing protein [Methylobacterium sp. WL9]TXN25049.1 EAL domain-containing protein [Methylobacterium sp. WL9]
MLDDAIRPTGAAGPTDRDTVATAPAGCLGMASADTCEPRDTFGLGRLLGFAADIADTPIAAISLLGGNREWLRGCASLPGLTDFAHARGACPHGIEADGAVIVHDALADPLRRTHAVVTGEAGIRFYAGVPLLGPKGDILGWLSVADRLPRAAFPGRARTRLKRLARIATERLEAGRAGAVRDHAHSFMGASQFAMLISDGVGTIRLANPACERMLGYEPGAMLGLNVRVIVPARFHGPHTAGMAAMVAGGTPRLAGKSVEVTAVKRDGTELPIELSLSSWRSEAGLAIGAVIRDSSERRNRDARLLRLAHQDPRSGLPNRNRVVEELGAIQAGGGEATVLALGVEGLRGANDSLGYAIGDALLEALSVRLTARLDAGALLARIQGDELAVLLPGRADPLAAQACAQALVSAFAEPIQVGDHPLHVGVAIGAALVPNHGSEAEEVLASADLALHQARRDGGRCFRLFEPAMRSAEAARRDLLDRLRIAVELGELELHYQPQVDIETGRICGSEALIRWRHPERGLLLPGEFLPAIEASVLALSVGWWTIDEACRQTAAWRASGLPAARVAVNLFGAQLRAGTLDAVVAEALERHGLAPADIEIEVTETTALRPDDTMLRPLRNLHASGVGIAFDDFGTGFASLSTLKNFPLTKLKIDRSFVRDLLTDPFDAAIVKGMLDIGRGLDLHVIAEGIETAEQEAALRDMGCRLAQGFRYGKALEPHVFASRLAADAGHPAALPLADLRQAS